MGLPWFRVERPTWPFSAATCRRVPERGAIEPSGAPWLDDLAGLVARPNRPVACSTQTIDGIGLVKNLGLFQILVAAEVTRLKHQEVQSLLTSAATVSKGIRPSEITGDW